MANVCRWATTSANLLEAGTGQVLQPGSDLLTLNDVGDLDVGELDVGDLEAAHGA